MGEVTRTALRILTFRAGRDELAALDNRHLRFGIACTWIVGVGRWWDDPGANILQHLGLESLIYVFVLTAFLWLLIRPLNPMDFSYTSLLTYVTLTAPPAILYAVPIERWMDLDSAQTLNAWLLGVVALWRIAMLFVYLRRVSQFKWFRLSIALLLPLCGIVTTLTLLNLERAAVDIMGGIPEDGVATSSDLSYRVLYLATVFSIFALPLLLGAYFAAVSMDARKLMRAQQELNRPKS